MIKVRRILLILLISISAMMYSDVSYGQCPMCHISAESNLANGGSEGKGLNNGILYMLSLPYLLVGAFGFYLWRYYRKNPEDELEVLP